MALEVEGTGLVAMIGPVLVADWLIVVREERRVSAVLAEASFFHGWVLSLCGLGVTH